MIGTIINFQLILLAVYFKLALSNPVCIATYYSPKIIWILLPFCGEKIKRKFWNTVAYFYKGVIISWQWGGGIQTKSIKKKTINFLNKGSLFRHIFTAPL